MKKDDKLITAYALSKVLQDSPLTIRDTASGDVEAVEHPLYRLLTDKVNKWSTSSTWIAELSFNAIKHGQSRSLIVRYDNGTICELINIGPDVTDEIDPSRVLIINTVMEDSDWKTWGKMPTTFEEVEQLEKKRCELINKWYDAIERELNEKLLSEDERETMRIEFTRSI